jgi:hypothetical protein
MVDTGTSDGKSKKRRNLWFIVGCVLIFTIPIVGTLGYMYHPYTWGSDGKLSVGISMDRGGMSLNGTIDVTIVLRNSGSTTVRLNCGSNYPYFSLTGENGESVKYNYFGPAMSPPRRLTDQEFNEELREFKPGDTITGKGSIRRYVNGTHQWDGTSGWDLKANTTYRVTGMYDSGEQRGFPVHPYWTGTVRSEHAYFLVRE